MSLLRPIRLGVELTATSDPGVVVDTAVAAERLGYDLLVLAGEHDEGSPDAWTLLSWIAARTERIGLVSSESEATRLPTVRARATAGLDLLSAGRVSSALSGEPERLAESVPLMRRMWDTSARRVDHHSGRAACRGRSRPVAGARHRDLGAWRRF